MSAPINHHTGPLGYPRRPRRLRPRACFRCGAVAGVMHLHLMLAIGPANGREAPASGRSTNRGAGSIDLCRPCWELATDAAALRRRSPHRDRLAVAR